MGVPAFFRWLTRRYPQIMTTVTSQSATSGLLSPTLSSPYSPIPEIDRLYIDMNGIIHQCTHGDTAAASPPRNESDMFALIDESVDRLLRTVRPRQLLFIAIDGVAPRAKLNQQRTRRYKQANTLAMNTATAFDANVITPGTTFMQRLIRHMRSAIQSRLINAHPLYAHLTVIFSDSSVAGEGEHKLLHFIRQQRMQPGADPNIVHCIYGSDADLIMLGLATHEAHFYVIRDSLHDIVAKCDVCKQTGHWKEQCNGNTTRNNHESKANRNDADSMLVDDDEGKQATSTSTSIATTRRTTTPSKSAVSSIDSYNLISLPLLRLLLTNDLQFSVTSFAYDIERVIDDFVFLCMFCGNDFLPSLPPLDIREGAIDRLMHVYKRIVPRVGGWLTDCGTLHFENIESLLSELSTVEEDIYQRRLVRAVNDKMNIIRHKQRVDKARAENAANHLSHNAHARVPAMTDDMTLHDSLKSYVNVMRQPVGNGNSSHQRPMLLPTLAPFPTIAAHDDISNKSAAQMLKARMHAAKTKTPTLSANDSAQTPNVTNTASRAENDPLSDALLVRDPLAKDASESKSPVADGASDANGDEFQLGQPNWRTRYYEVKLAWDITTQIGQVALQEMVRAYVQGLAWVTAYYYHGCPDWEWFYPYHYAPLVCHMTRLTSLLTPADHNPYSKSDTPPSRYGVRFKHNTRPFDTLTQLMAVMPKKSAKCLPAALQRVMDDPTIAAFYPDEVRTDRNGYRHEWQHITLLPFIDQTTLIRALHNVVAHLGEDERAVNAIGHDFILKKVDTEPENEEDDGESEAAKLAREYWLKGKQQYTTCIDGVLMGNFELPMAQRHHSRMLDGVRTQNIITRNHESVDADDGVPELLQPVSPSLPPLLPSLTSHQPPAPAEKPVGQYKPPIHTIRVLPGPLYPDGDILRPHPAFLPPPPMPTYEPTELMPIFPPMPPPPQMSMSMRPPIMPPPYWMQPMDPNAMAAHMTQMPPYNMNMHAQPMQHYMPYAPMQEQSGPLSTTFAHPQQQQQQQGNMASYYSHNAYSQQTQSSSQSPFVTNHRTQNEFAQQMFAPQQQHSMNWPYAHFQQQHGIDNNAVTSMP